ncbi:hypothetical protein [Rhizobium sp. GN54]|uniref:hypothetical protein n=1 Tax=Rhizobium sp. GN54 TaxID=2898150 RepID=UPI001E4D7D93|nr:hypothetical protein [Rhizobium sp. GN54]MCD2180477.1 hypothetical protein [Rhizobium sp. GN54]
MIRRFCRQSVYPRIASKEACCGSNVIFGLVLIVGVAATAAMLISRLVAAI